MQRNIRQALRLKHFRHGRIEHGQHAWAKQAQPCKEDRLVALRIDRIRQLHGPEGHGIFPGKTAGNEQLAPERSAPWIGVAGHVIAQGGIGDDERRMGRSLCEKRGPGRGPGGRVVGNGVRRSGGSRGDGSYFRCGGVDLDD